MAKKNFIQQGQDILSEGVTMTKKEETTLDVVKGVVDTYAAEIEAIMLDYIADTAMIEEIREKTRQLMETIAKPVGMLELDRQTRCKQLAEWNKEIKDLKEEVDERDDTIKDLRKQLEPKEDKEPEALTFDQVLEQLKEMSDEEMDKEELIDLVGEDAVKEWANDNDFICVKVENLVQREKVENFLTTEIWPEYNLQSANLNF